MKSLDMFEDFENKVVAKQASREVTLFSKGGTSLFQREAPPFEKLVTSLSNDF